MFPAILSKVYQNIDTVRKSIETSERVRTLVAGNDPNSHSLGLSALSPSMKEWRVYDHCAVLTRLYAIYESFVEELLSDVLTILPTLFTYIELGDGFQKEHRNGIAYLLQKIDSYRYR